MVLMLNLVKFCDLVKAGIVDPTKVVRTALIDAVSVAAYLTTTEAMITDKPEEKSAPAMPDIIDLYRGAFFCPL